MADPDEPVRKRRKKLMVGETVEVGYSDQGLLGSWHLGVVVKCGWFFRVVEHTNLLDDDSATKCVEVIPVSAAIEGTFSATIKYCRQRIRPVPPHSNIQSSDIRYGLCVDALVNEGWWEGVVFDHVEGSKERRVFFPDLGDQEMITIDQMRLTLDWDEVSGDWKPRGEWLLLKILQKFEDEGPLPVSIRQIWYDLRATHAFEDKIKSWTLGTKDIWHKLVSELIQELWSVVIGVSVPEVFSNQLVNHCMTSIEIDTPVEDVPCSEVAGLQLDGMVNSIDKNGSSELHIPNDYAFNSDVQSSSQLMYDNQSSNRAVVETESSVSDEVGYSGEFLQSHGRDKELSKPVVYSKVLQDFILACRNKSCPQDLRKNLYVLRCLARSHLTAAGWKLAEDVQGRKYYVSPAGKRFWTLVTACEAWKTVEENSNKTTDCVGITYNHACDEQGTLSNLKHNKAEHISSSRFEKSWRPLQLIADYCPEVVEFYASILGDGKPRLKNLMWAKFDHKTLAKKVKMHLLALGWTIEFRKDTILRFRFSSPQGRIYYSLKKVCYDLMGHHSMDQECDDCDDFEGYHLSFSANKMHSVVAYDEKFSDINLHCAASGKKDVEFRENEDIRPENLPEAITEYMGYMDSLMQNGKQELLNADVKLLRLNAKKHLLYMGWDFWLKDKKTRLELRYRSPIGRSFSSLITACKAYLKEYKNSTLKTHNLVNNQKKFKLQLTAKPNELVENDKQWKLKTISNAAKSNDLIDPVHFLDEEAVRASTFSCNSSEFGERKFGKLRFKRVAKLKKKSMDLSSSLSPSRENMLTCLSGQKTECQQSKRRVASQPVRQCIKLDKSFSPRVRRSSTRLQQLAASPSSQHSAKTVLSWLIDNDILLPRQKVYCMCRRYGQSRKEGRVSRDGIKCMCCRTLFNLANFAAHGGNNTRRPSAAIFLADGRSLLQCQMQMLHSSKHKVSPHIRLKGDCSQLESDAICSICQDGGELILCDHCPSSFHITCIGLEDVPEGKWFCPSCRCGICGLSEYNCDIEQFTKTTILYCDQCEGEYHVGCLRQERLQQLGSCPTGNWFCSNKCSKIFYNLRTLMGKSNRTSLEGLSWTLLRWRSNDNIDPGSSDLMAEHHSKLCLALDVLHECFVPLVEPRTQSDLVDDLIFNKESELNRLNFWGFYTMLLEKGDELVSVATFRVYGEKVAEMPFVGTRVSYRRMGMCRLLVNELEKLLCSLGVERLLLPAVPRLLETWTTSFGFKVMSSSDRVLLSKYSLLNFEGTTMCEKLLQEAETALEIQTDRSTKSLMQTECENYSLTSEVLETVKPVNTYGALANGSSSLSDEVDGSEDSHKGDAFHYLTWTSCTDQLTGTMQNNMNEELTASVVAGNAAAGERGESCIPPTVTEKPTTDLVRHFGKCYKRNRKAGVRSVDMVTATERPSPTAFKYFYQRRTLVN